MAKSPELQRAHDFFKAFAEKAFAPGATLEEMRRAYDGLDRPGPGNVTWTKTRAQGVAVEWACPADRRSDTVLLYLHGGGFMMGSTNSHRGLIARLAIAADARAFALNYRLTPEFPFPSAIEDTVAAYDWLITEGIRPEKILLAGDSAGGGVALSALLLLRDTGRPLPAGAVLVSPWVDLALTGESMMTRAAADPVVQKDALEGLAQAYLAGRAPNDPLASPIYADFRGLPPLLIHVGDAETLLDDARRLALRAKAAGVDVHLEVWEDMIHEWHIFADILPEAEQAIERIGRFVRMRAG